MKVLITFALANEFAPWRKLRRFERVSGDAWDPTYTATIGECEVRVVVTGAGRFAAQRSLAHAFDDAPEVCIASGLCGGLKSSYAPGDVLGARRSSTDSSFLIVSSRLPGRRRHSPQPATPSTWKAFTFLRQPGSTVCA